MTVSELRMTKLRNELAGFVTKKLGWKRLSKTRQEALEEIAKTIIEVHNPYSLHAPDKKRKYTNMIGEGLNGILANFYLVIV